MLEFEVRIEVAVITLAFSSLGLVVVKVSWSWISSDLKSLVAMVERTRRVVADVQRLQGDWRHGN